MRRLFLYLAGVVSIIGLGACTAPLEAQSGYEYRHYGIARPGSTYGYGSTYVYPRYVYVPPRPHLWDRRWRRFDHDHHARRDDHDPHGHDFHFKKRKHGGGWRGPTIEPPGPDPRHGWRPGKRPPKDRPVVKHDQRGPKMQPVPRIIDQLEAQGYSRIEPKKRRGRTLTVTAEDNEGGKSVLVIDRKGGRVIERPQARR